MSAADLVEGYLARAQIAFKVAGNDRWAAQMRGDHKLTIPVMIAVTGNRITFESFFMRRPQENVDRFYGLLLRRNMRAYAVHFSLDAVGDVFLVGQRPLAGLDEDELDRIMGAILIEADGSFDAAIAVGFASYLESDMRWRAANADR